MKNIDDTDIDFDEGLNTHRSKMVSSRRRKNTDDNIEVMNEITQLNNEKPRPSLTNSTQPAPQINTKPQTISGWVEETSFTPQQPTVKTHRRELGTGLTTFPKNENEMKTKLQKREMSTDNDDIPAIPDLEETNETEDLAFQVAEAPDVQIHQLSTYKELDKEFFKEKAFQFLEGNIDVSLLHCGLNTEEQLAEEDDAVWEWNKLFTEIVSFFTAEEEANTESASKLAN